MLSSHIENVPLHVPIRSIHAYGQYTTVVVNGRKHDKKYEISDRRPVTVIAFSLRAATKKREGSYLQRSVRVQTVHTKTKWSEKERGWFFLFGK